MQTEAELQTRVLTLWAELAATIGGLVGIIGGDIDTQAKVQAKRDQIAALESSSLRNTLLAALDNLLSFYAGAGS